MKFLKFALITLAITASSITAQAQDSTDQDSISQDGGAYGELGLIVYGEDPDLEGLEAKLGYSFNKHFGVEAQGSIGTNRDDAVFDFDAESVTVGVKVDYSVAAFGIARLPITDRFQIFARGGLHNTKVSVEVEDGGIPDFNRTETGLAVGGGLQYNFSEKNGIRLEYTYLDKNDANSTSLAYVRKF